MAERETELVLLPGMDEVTRQRGRERETAPEGQNSGSPTPDAPSSHGCEDIPTASEGTEEQTAKTKGVTRKPRLFHLRKAGRAAAGFAKARFDIDMGPAALTALGVVAVAAAAAIVLGISAAHRGRSPPKRR
ncbi:hypothetical protein KIPB_002085 [Kipferlia bialata]|uniref:Uncharacterized protein n=1 Tax=Kipferlia bialata TaxID=797122 RepID=A0A9K3CRP4_9EUKA|nr:hypothetical protein KIPB_002085 [Kipferlia bialata]|eukprot:g2085.t1